mmetsp:Transcript_1775/g.4036  ORF Transcript_1775/g.4036 Transcript_1775/m.4036 type:complete len:151 (-) Transcript_1775:67-519(-)
MADRVAADFADLLEDADASKEVDLVVANAALALLARRADTAAACLRFFRRVPQKNAATFNAALNAAATDPALHPVVACELLEEMRALGLAPDQATANIVAKIVKTKCPRFGHHRDLLEALQAAQSSATESSEADDDDDDNDEKETTTTLL